MFPSADHIAIAIVTACRLNGENPLAIVEQRPQRSRARHYALYALACVFPEASKAKLAFLVGCQGNPVYYARNSMAGHYDGKQKHTFWNRSIEARVIEAVEACTSKPAPAVEAPPAPKAEPQFTVPMSRPFVSERQMKAYRMLQEAVANTAKLPK